MPTWSTLLTWMNSKEFFFLVADKVAFIVASLTVGWIGAWYWEGHKGRIARENAIAPRRVETIGAIETRINSLIERFLHLRAECRAELLDNKSDIDKHLASLWRGEGGWNSTQFGPIMGELVDATAPYRSGISRELHGIEEDIQTQAFWLGAKNADRLKERVRLLGLCIAPYTFVVLVAAPGQPNEPVDIRLLFRRADVLRWTFGKPSMLVKTVVRLRNLEYAFKSWRRRGRVVDAATTAASS